MSWTRNVQNKPRKDSRRFKKRELRQVPRTLNPDDALHSWIRYADPHDFWSVSPVLHMGELYNLWSLHVFVTRIFYYPLSLCIANLILNCEWRSAHPHSVKHSEKTVPYRYRGRARFWPPTKWTTGPRTVTCHCTFFHQCAILLANNLSKSPQSSDPRS